MHDNILSLIGHTPLIRLRRLFRDAPFEVYGKLELFNPGGSIKDRAALSILRNALESGEIQPTTAIIESSSGNMGIGLAQVCAHLRLRFICVVDPKTTQQNIRLLQTYGAEVDLVRDPDTQSGEFLQARLNRVQHLLKTIDGSIWTDQYSNQMNAAAHYYTMAEIASQMDNKIDYLFCATSTCGTLRGCATYIHEHHLPTQIIAVDAVGSVIFGGKSSKRLIPGHGAAVQPALYQLNLAQRVVHITDLECVVGCWRLLQSETILAGGSSGALVAALDQVRYTLPPKSRCVIIICDRGERYMDTIYSRAWVESHFDNVDIFE